MAKRGNEQGEADAVAEKADDAEGQGLEKTGRPRPHGNDSTTLLDPAARPLIIAIWSGSAEDSLRVRLLSIPQATQAATYQKRA